MVEVKPSKPKEDKSVLLNSTMMSEIEYEDKAKCSAFCMFVSACLFLVYLCLVILLSWILRGYLYSILKRYLRIEGIHELALQSDENTYNSINPPNLVYEMIKNKPEPFELTLKSLDNKDNGDNSPSLFDLDQIEYSIIQHDQSLPDELDSVEEITVESPHLIETDTLTGIINNMTDFIMSELEFVETSLKSNAEKLGNNSINMDDIDLFSDHIISNITSILEEEVKLAEESLKSNIEHMEKEIQNNYHVDHNTGFMGFLSDIFKHTNERESIERSYVPGKFDNEYYDSYSPFEHRFDIMDPHAEPEPEPEPDNHKDLESKEDVLLTTAVQSIRNLFTIDKNKMYKENSDADRVLLKPEEQHLNIKMLFLQYMEIFGLVLAVMSLVTFILMFIIFQCIKMSDRRKVITRYKLQETINDNNQHVI